jgi:hypothetical protein
MTTPSGDVFSQESIRKWSSSDFKLDTDEKISLKSKDCSIILFYGENEESKQLMRIFSLVSQQAAGPMFGACNLLREKEVSLAFTNIKAMGSHPFHWASMRGYPFILTYRDGWPVAFYNGDRSVTAILDWTMTLACQANYYERFQAAGGVGTTSKLEMQGTPAYPSADGKLPTRTESTQYKTTQPIRPSPAEVTQPK